MLLRGLVAEAMRDLGLTVVEAASADEARRYLQAGGGAELVVTDVEMPGRMDGIQLGRWVRQTYPGIGLILTSGKPGISVAGLGQFIPKPYGIFEMAKIARRMMDEKQGEGDER